MLLQHSTSPEMSIFIDALTSTNASLRTVRYFAIAEVVVNRYYGLHSTKIGLNLSLELSKFNTIVDAICELTIVDRPVLSSIFHKVFNYYYSKLYPEPIAKRLLNFNSFSDVIGTTDYYSPDDVFLINREFVDYRSTMLKTIKVVDKLVPETDITL